MAESMLDKWYTDDQVRDTAHAMEQAFLSLPSQNAPGTPPVPELVPVPIPQVGPDAVAGRPTAADAEPFLCLHPAKILENHDKANNALEKSDSDYIDEYVGRMRDVLARGWSGDSAEGFQRKVDNIRSFIDDQRENYGQVQKALVANYALAVQSRNDFVNFANAAIRAIEKFKAEQRADAEEVLLGILGGIVGAAISSVTAGVGGQALAVAASAAGSTITNLPALVGGESLDELATSYRDAYNRLKTSFTDQLAELAAYQNTEREKILERPTTLLDPLPPKHTDVHSPNFSYEYFSSGWRPPEPTIVSQVKQAADQHAEGAATEKGDENNTIRRVLDGEQ